MDLALRSFSQRTGRILMFCWIQNDDWALRHLELFPVEVNRADYGTLLRVPGLGVKSARRILAARRSGSLDFPDLKKMGVVLKRAMYFLTCQGRMMAPIRMNENFITSS